MSWVVDAGAMDIERELLSFQMHLRQWEVDQITAIPDQGLGFEDRMNVVKAMKEDLMACQLQLKSQTVPSSCYALVDGGLKQRMIRRRQFDNWVSRWDSFCQKAVQSLIDVDGLYKIQKKKLSFSCEKMLQKRLKILLYKSNE